MSYLQKHLNTPSTQREQTREDQVENTAGGFVFKIDKWDQLMRFLIIGTEGGTYYAGQRKLTRENTGVVMDCIREDGVRAVAITANVSDTGRAPKNDQALYVLALAIRHGDKDTKRAASVALKDVARIGTHILNFVSYADSLGGWGRVLRDAVSDWYNSRSTHRLAYQLAKYQQRDGWSHRDVFRLAHPKPITTYHDLVFKWVVGKAESGDEVDMPRIIIGLELAKKAETEEQVAALIKEYGLTHEMIPTEFKNKVSVQSALLDKMPITALIRNLGNLSKSGLVVPGQWENIERVLEKLNETAIKRGRVHPLNILVAAKTYAQGKGFRGKGMWKPVSQIIHRLDEAFYWAFHSLQETGLRHYVGIDVSGSMGQAVMGTNLSCSEAAGAMAMTRIRVEDKCVSYGFSSGGRQKWKYGRYDWRSGAVMEDLGIRSTDNIDVVAKKCQRPFGATDCALPMIHALENGMAIDVFEIYTDNETWIGKVHPYQALQNYRKATGINARLAVIGMTSTGFSIADPKDNGMLDFVGFDSALPTVINAFARGEF